jgi:tetratricopeptide (TPR) repeat protein
VVETTQGIAPMSRKRLIETFNTHRMTAEVVQAVATARDLELVEIIKAVRRAASQSQQAAQHLIVYGERGSGKSFLMRMVEIEIERLAREEGLQVVSALLPEEQYNIRTAPQLILAIAAKVRGAGWEDSAFTLEFRPLAEAWQAAVDELDTVLDQRFGQAQGLVVAMVENFDTLTSSLFGSSSVTQKKAASARAVEQSSAEQLLRKLMNAKGSRLMLIAAATGTVDQDYDRPLFQAFKTLDLRIWSSDDCIVYFNRRRELEHQVALSPQEEARARAIAEFIGGNPRLAQLLGEALASPDARSIATILDSLSDHLADYYRRRLDDLPPQSVALLDALIRKGEPCTQTELAARVGANSQAQIADAFKYLQSGRLLVADQDAQGAGKLYRLRDRLFVHFYRRRYGEPEQALGLAPIAELLESFFTLREREQQARRHLEVGEWADAKLYALNSPFLCESLDGYCRYRDDCVIGAPSELFHLAGLNVAEAVDAQAELKQQPKLSVKRWKDVADRADSGLNRTAALLLETKALSRCQMDNEAEAILVGALQNAEAGGDQDSQILVLDEMIVFADSMRKDRARALDFAARSGELADQADNRYVRNVALCDRVWNLSSIEVGHYQEAIIASDEAAELAVCIGSQHLQAYALSLKAYSLNQLERYDEAVSVAEKAVIVEAVIGVSHYQIQTLKIMAEALSKLGNHERVELIYGKAAQLAADINDISHQSRLLWLQAESLQRLKRLEQALVIARESANLAAKIGEIDVQAAAVFIASQILFELEKYAEAATAVEEAAQLADSAGNTALQLMSLNCRAMIFGLLNQHEQAIELAQRVFELGSTTGEARFQVMALGFKMASLSQLGRTDEVISTFDAAFSLAKMIGETHQLIATLEAWSILQGQQKSDQILVLAREIIVEFGNKASEEYIWTVRRIFFEAARRTPAVDFLEIFEACLDEVTTNESARSFTAMLAEVLAAVAYNDVWDDFIACLLRHSEVLPLLKSPAVFIGVGEVWSEQVKADGRAQTYAVIARQLPAIVRLTELLPLADSETDGHLRGLINGLVNHCDDAGFLQDLADLLREGFGGLVEAEVQSLRFFAQVHAATDKEKVLQRLDPDLALAIRRVLELPEPIGRLAQKGRRKGR